MEPRKKVVLVQKKLIFTEEKLEQYSVQIVTKT